MVIQCKFSWQAKLMVFFNENWVIEINKKKKENKKGLEIFLTVTVSVLLYGCTT